MAEILEPLPSVIYLQRLICLLKDTLNASPEAGRVVDELLTTFRRLAFLDSLSVNGLVKLDISAEAKSRFKEHIMKERASLIVMLADNLAVERLVS